ncbi:MAG TPA: hypothetical protein VEW94_04945 [Chloroflexia bacterium]|nr:hypothetical protein [Chloroflexia bacterium]
MRRRVVRERGSPIYIRGDSGVIALVPEVGVQEARMPRKAEMQLRVLSPSAVYVIDGDGVRRVAFGRVRPGRVVLLLLALVAAPLQYLLSRHKGGRRGA